MIRKPPRSHKPHISLHYRNSSSVKSCNGWWAVIQVPGDHMRATDVMLCVPSVMEQPQIRELALIHQAIKIVELWT